MRSVQEILDYIDRVEEGYEVDPSDSDYQDGYFDALINLREFIQE